DYYCLIWHNNAWLF
nr:immunoglobulin light chain junction region [Macaca mulatta]MOX77447.1 immunoglobulin light chain junction region [Macaca mulatta]MOX77458.1 immunoglobulin light chain junction region [Macaca mulatta]MOX77460.1 immunoglobulin light chain junction region [Macaca mulatta]MOX77484.1 immunoglobulin light chain junction region [Macaca mulatta]